MNLITLGYNETLENYRKDYLPQDFEVGRVIAEHKERYIVSTGESDYEAEIVGNMRYTATERADFPAVGDWVALSIYDQDKALIHHVFPRKTLLERQAVGKYGEKQLIATNIDVAFIVQAVDRDFNMNRIERYVTICNNSNIESVIILNKIDLLEVDKVAKMRQGIKERIPHLQIVPISNETNEGIKLLKNNMIAGQTYCLLGSSGVGKSTLLNNLSGKEVMQTGVISKSIQRGKHVTTHRALVMLDNGALMIDNPGMREVGITDASEGIEQTFNQIYEYARDCKYADCKHTSETGCAVLKALHDGVISQEVYENYQKMEREKAHFEATVADKRKKEKAFGKMFKNYQKFKKRNEY